MQLINSVFYYFLKLIMESEGERKIKEFVSVKDLQSSLFPSGKKNVTGSYFANFLMKASNTEEESDDDIIKIKRAHSRELYSIGRDSILANQPARWPTECQVLDERIFHINYNPPTLEPYYQPTGREVQPKPTGDECGIIVYQYTPISAVNYFTRSSIGGSKYLLSTNICPEEDSLKFESRFESGNLARAVRITPHYYELHLRSDLYTHRHMQWFYFRVTNMKKFQLYRFSIVNLTKEGSLYNEGMKPLMYSKTDAQTHLIGWRRCGENITYFNNDITTTETDQQTTYTLTFTVMFPHDNDEVYLANCYPYTYSDLQDYLLELTAHPVKSSYTTLRLLCKTLAGNNVYYITITSPPASVDFDGSGNGEPIKKKAVVLSARVHPGETPSSWIMKGVIDFLTGDSSPAKELRDKFIFKLVPMLNPDGVIVGNTRCSLSAKDLNRQYRTVMRDAYPSIWYTKLMIRRLLEECGVSLYCDFHAHSRKHNIFIYGCENRNGGDKKLQEQVFPLMLHKNTADKFSFEDCKFRIQKAKEGTGRVVMWMMGIVNSYTLEASFAGSTLGNRNETHFSALDFEQMGRSFCQTLLDFYDEEPRKEKLRTKILCRLTMEGSNADEPTNIPLSDFSSDEGDTSSSSNEGGNFHPYKSIPPPPPSPMHMKKPKPKKDLKNKKQSKNKCVFLRKPLPIRKATLSLGVSTKGSDESETSSETEDEHEKAMVEKIRFVRRRKCKKKTLRKQEPAIEAPVSDAETPVIKSTVSVLEFIPDENKKNAIPRDRTPQPQWPARHTQLKSATEIKLSKQLEEVQSKLLAIKSKLWYGTGNGDLNEPLSWGLSTMNLEDSTSRSPNKCHKKHSKRRQSKSKLEKVPPAKEKQKKTENKMNCSKKSQNGLKRQSAIEVPLKEKLIRKSRSLPDASDSKFKEKTKIVLNSSDEPDVTNNIKNTKETSNTKTRKKSAKKHKFAKTTSLNGKVPSRKV